MRYGQLPAGARRAIVCAAATIALYLVPIGLVVDDMSRPVVCGASGSGGGGVAVAFTVFGLAGLLGTVATLAATVIARRDTETLRVWPLRLAVVAAPIATLFLLFDDALRGLQCGFF
jgi:hypothetical protein